MTRINLSADNGPTSKYLTAHGRVCIPSPGDAWTTCPPQKVPWAQASFAPSTQPAPTAVVFGELSPSPTSPRPHHCHRRRRDPGGAPGRRTSQSHLPRWRDWALSRGFSGWSTTYHAKSTVLRYQDMPSLGWGTAKHSGTSPLCCPKWDARGACPCLGRERER